MTCQHCQTWILDGEHRCSRCGRRARAMASRISPSTYPIAAAATAAAYDFEPESSPVAMEAGQRALFLSSSTDTRVIPFASLASPVEREAIRMRAAETQRPSPLKTVKIESQGPRRKAQEAADQRRLEFQDEVVSQPGSQVARDALIATASVRISAAAIDSLIVLAGLAVCVGIFIYAGGRFAYHKQALPFLTGALLTVPVFYKLLWAFAGQDSLGTQMVKLELVDFDGKRPSHKRRYLRLFGSFVSLLAAGLGMFWALIDEDKLTWHDHISGTFPTFSGENSGD